VQFACRERRLLGQRDDPVGAETSEDRFAAAAEAAVQEAAPLRHNACKVPLTKALLPRAPRTLTDQACR